MEKTILSNNNYNKFDKDYPYGYPWPPRYYTCSFCKREFRSAQALGGHMNIHRRDRARLRELSPSNTNNNPLSSNNSDQNPNPNPNPNPNLNPSVNLSTSSSSTNNIYAQQYSLVSLSLSSIPHSTKNGCEDDSKGVFGKRKNMSSDQEIRVLESNNINNSSIKEVVRLDLELCLREAKEEESGELDLELRLGI